jgi:hypothetical protein
MMVPRFLQLGWGRFSGSIFLAGDNIDVADAGWDPQEAASAFMRW